MTQELLDYFNGDDLAASVWLNKYALKDSQGNIFEETPNDMHERMAKEIYRAESKYKNPLSKEEIFDLIKDFKYIVPQGGPMTGIGNPFQIASLSNCFVIGNDSDSDSYGGIMKVDQEQIQLMKRRGGVGHDLSHIRPKGSAVKNSALTSTGIVPFMERYSNSTREVAQDGRRGALMLSVSINHPDAEDFIDAKLEQGKVTGANISVKIDDEFMNQVRLGGDYVQKYPIHSDEPKVSKTVEATAIWKKIVHNAWQSAEPGILFWDTIINESVADCYADLGYKTVSTNPCGEIPLCPYDSCRLLALNLFSYVKNPFTLEAKFDFKLFKEHIAYAQRIMDDIIDLEIEKIDGILDKLDQDPESYEVKAVEIKLWENIKKKSKEGRRAGIGITAEGDMLAALGIRYGSEEGNAFSIKVHKTLAVETYRGSVELAKERGAFGIFDAEREKNNPFVLRLKKADKKLYEEMVEHGRRNIALLTIAPTGTTSLMTQTTSGIEPVFLPVYKRRKKVNPNDKNSRIDFIDEVGDSWEEYVVFHHRFKQWMEVNGVDTDKNYSQEQIDELIKNSPYYKATSNDVDWVSKVTMQGAVQKWVDHSISVTVNLPSDVEEELVGELYLKAWEVGCKGVTVYRDGSRSGVLVSNNEKKEDEFVQHDAPKRPKELDAEVFHVTSKGERFTVVVGLYDSKPYEIFCLGGEQFKNHASGKLEKKYRGAYAFDGENLDFNVTDEEVALTRMISTSLRHGADIKYVVEQLNKADGTIVSFSKAISRTLKKYIPDGEKSTVSCNECGSENVIFEEGCNKCLDCGSSKCG